MESHTHRFHFETEAQDGAFVGACACGETRRCPTEPRYHYPRGKNYSLRPREPLANIRFGAHFENGLAW